MADIVDMNSIPQHEVAKGRGQSEFFRAKPTAKSSFVAKKPAPSTPTGVFSGRISIEVVGFDNSAISNR